MANRLTVGSLFSGIGGFDLGFERAGFDIAWQVEFDPFCQSVLKKHWPNAKLYSDIREVNANELQPVDVVCGGFPCQPVSVSGKQKGREDERWLWPEFARIVRGIRPAYVVVENVPGLLTVDGGRLFGTVLGDLAACGYNAEWQVLPASVFGAWHRRDRLFIVAYSDCQRLEKREVFGSDAEQKLAALARDCSTGAGIWAVESGICRTLDGVSNRVERLRALGNAIVPQVAEFVARMILAHAQE
jgi:DNA (cytosine-5)-methyltransferase 1